MCGLILLRTLVVEVTLHKKILFNHLCEAYHDTGGKFLKKLWCCVGGSITR